MKEHGIYFGKESFYNLIRGLGGTWNHRNDAAKQRIQNYIGLDMSDIRSCYYHIGNTDQTSIFFISDAVPITEEYIEREYLGKYTREHYCIQNKKLLAELERKLARILAWEKANPNSFRQHITDVLKKLAEGNSEC